ncbi:MAG TPA: hypothetical protein PLI05_08950 [Methanotrichaceae archaeon]|nr:hypothetical protein [Methanotrichaceae archaeon]HQF17179.1 hypothetical protein [Methanotrichaceae archaeon]HQI91752.1 hypothetical protein [Methanotrichaceae archaeon]HQJ29047.1 hypothetical protein [Methanotrichaceae archaeon]
MAQDDLELKIRPLRIIAPDDQLKHGRISWQSPMTKPIRVHGETLVSFHQEHRVS